MTKIAFNYCCNMFENSHIRQPVSTTYTLEHVFSISFSLTLLMALNSYVCSKSAACIIIWLPSAFKKLEQEEEEFGACFSVVA